MAHITTDQLVAMELHEEVFEDSGWSITRVHSGWIYRRPLTFFSSTAVFVPVGATFAMIPRASNDKRTLDGTKF